MWQLQLLLALVGGGLVKAVLPWNDFCYLRPHSAPFQNETNYLEIPSNCSYGEVDWDYPSGILDIHLNRNDGPYSLCLETSWGTSLGGLKKVVNGVVTDIPLPEKDKPSCGEDTNGKATLLVLAAPPQMYMTNFAYRVVPRIAV